MMVRNGEHVPKRKQWEHQEGDTYAAVLTSIVGDASHFEITHQLAGAARSELVEAIHDGFGCDRSDDFNIGVWNDGKLVALLWMHEVVDDEPYLMFEIAHEHGMQTKATA